MSNYYSKVLSKSADLQTNCCTTTGAPPLFLQRALSNVHSDVADKYFGCGFLTPELLQGLRVLDMGCGAGRDCFVLAQLVGESGRVVGVDMAEEQLTTARATVDWHRERFGYQQANTVFLKGYLENLLSASTTGGSPRKVPRGATSVGGAAEDGAMEGVTQEQQGAPSTEGAAEGDGGGGASMAEAAAAELVEDSFDVIVSNCVINLSPDKAAVLGNAYRLLKPGKPLSIVWFSSEWQSISLPLALCQV